MQRKTFTHEFKQECVNLVIQYKYQASLPAETMNVGLSTLQCWLQQYRGGTRRNTLIASAITPQSEVDNTFILTATYATKAQAMRAAQAKWDKLQRGAAEFSITLAVGRTKLYPETPVKVKGFKPVKDNQPRIMTKNYSFAQ